MAMVKSRGSKRSSSVFSPTATITVFVALCIVGVYMLSTTSNASPESESEEETPTTTTKTSERLSTSTDSSRRKSTTEDTNEDNSGNLPEDSIKSDDPDSSNDEKSSEESNDTKNQSNSNEDSSGDETSNVDRNRQTERETDGGTSDDQIQRDETPTKTYEDTTQHLEEDSLHNESKNSQKTSSQEMGENKGDLFPSTGGTGIPKESQESKKSWSTQKGQSQDQKDRGQGTQNQGVSADTQNWKLCNVTAGPDYIPCLDNEAAIARLRSRSHFQHRERHCPDQAPTCLVPLPSGYKTPVKWPQSRDKIWYSNVPQTTLAQVKGHQNWVKVTGEFLTFPGGGTQFIHGASHYIDFIEKAWPDIAWGKHTRVILDVGCGVASFGGFLFDRDVIAISFAPKDEHTAQVQFALERGIPAISAVMGTKRLSFPSKVFDLVHCARCRVPWHADGGALLLELNRVLRPGGHFVWSATPVYQKLEEDVQIWKEMSALTKAMCWKLVTIKKDELNKIGAAIYKKPTSNDCYEQRKSKAPPMCKTNDDPNAAWYVPLQSCMHKVPTEENERGTKWPAEWPKRHITPPYWLDKSQMGIYGKPAPNDFTADYEHWKKLVQNTYLNGLGISWTDVRNVMDMRSVYGGFAAVLKDMKLWVMNVVNIDAPDTLPIIYERGFFGMYHDWCESFSTYPRTYDLMHADHLFSSIKKRCKIDPLIVEIDRVLRPGGKLIVRDESSVIDEVEKFLRSLHWEIRMTFTKNQQGILSAEKTQWRPDSYEDSS